MRTLRSLGVGVVNAVKRRIYRERIAAGTRTLFGQHRWERRVPLAETPLSAMHRERAEVKRARRRVRNIRVTWRQGYVYHEQELEP